jgi:hypothetical protein
MPCRGSVAEVENATPPARTVCHGCRAVSYEMIGEDDTQRHRPVVLPGDGQVMREVTPGMMVSQPCPYCADSEEDGWLDGFVIPA